MKKVYIFGAGASKADGLAMQSELLKNIFEFHFTDLDYTKGFLDIEIKQYDEDMGEAYDRFVEYRKELAIFLLESFGTKAQMQYADEKRRQLWDQRQSLSEHVEMQGMWDALLIEAGKINVTLEDVFTILDKTIVERRHFTNYSNESIIEIRKALQECIIFILSSQMEEKNSNKNYSLICKKIIKERLQEPQVKDNMAVITLNWDTKFEQTLQLLCEDWNNNNPTKKVFPDLCFYDYPFGSGEDRIPSTQIKSKGHYNIKLLKLHGSLNWLMCPKCGRVYVDYKKNIALKELGTKQAEQKYCRKCSVTTNRKAVEWPQLQSIIITPTYLKELDNLHLQNIWYNAYIDLTEADEIVFVGYSLPEADFELKNLLKRSINQEKKITVVLRREDNPDFYMKMLQKAGAKPQNIDMILSKMSFPNQRYSSLFQGNEIEYYYNGLENYFEEEQ